MKSWDFMNPGCLKGYPDAWVQCYNGNLKMVEKSDILTFVI